MGGERAVPAPVLVTGGTGTLGAHVVRRLRELGRNVRVMSRKERAGGDGVEYLVGDLVKASGVAESLAGVEVVVHCASAPSGDAQATRNLIEAARAQPSPPHLVYISVVGVQGVPFGYFKVKLAAEAVVAESDLPWTILRATQFYDFILTGAESTTRFPLVPAPKDFRVQPIDPAEVAARLVELALGPPSGRVPDIGGPEVTTWAQMIRQYLRARGRRRPVLEIWLPMMKGIRAGGLLVDAGSGIVAGAYGKTTWAEFLEQHRLG